MRSIVAGLIGLLSLPALANLDDEQGPMLELGAGIAGVLTPHYLGAKQDSEYLLPFPYFIYRGDYLRADRNGLRGSLFESDNVALRVSLGGSLPVNSDDNDAREGMDDLDTLVEFGPVLEWTLASSSKHEWKLEIPLRGVFSMGSSPLNHEGWTAQPRLEYTRFYNRWRWEVKLLPIFGDRRNHRYFYQVDGDEVRAGRPAFDAQSGYTGTRIGFSGRYRRDANMFGFSYNYYDLSGSDNKASPLFLQDDAHSLTFYFARILCSADSLSLSACR